MTTIPGYEPTRRTRLTLIVPNPAGGAPRMSIKAPADSLHDFESQLDKLQRAYLHERNRVDNQGAGFPPGMLHDEAGQLIARIGHEGEVWAVRGPAESALKLRDAPRQRPLDWTNCGDINPRQGTVLFRFGDAEFDSRGFTVPTIVVTPETAIGGSERVFELRQGDVFLASADYGSALETVGARLAHRASGPVIRIADHHDRIEEHAIASAEGIRLLAGAAHAFRGLDDVDAMSLVSIGLSDATDQPRRFTGETAYYRSSSSLWAVMRLELPWFSDIFPDERHPFRAEEIPEGLLEGMPADLETRADLAKAAAFAELERDDAGNPLVWRNDYVHEDCESPEDSRNPPRWSDDWSCQSDDECYCCGISISPAGSEWLGPDDPDLREAWEDLPEAVEGPSPSMSL